MNKPRSKRRKRPEPLYLRGLPTAVRRFYEERAQDINLSLDEYLTAKLASDYLFDVGVGGVGGRPVADIQPATKPSNGKPSNASTATQTALAAVKSGYKGVHAYGKLWAAVLYTDGGRHRLGTFRTAEEAARAYDAALVARAGGDPNAAVNFPTATDEALAEATPFIEKLATGSLDDKEWVRWGATPLPSAALPVKRPQNEEPDRTPLVRESSQPPKMLYRRGESLVDTLARTSPPLPPEGHVIIDPPVDLPPEPVEETPIDSEPITDTPKPPDPDE